MIGSYNEHSNTNSISQLRINYRKLLSLLLSCPINIFYWTINSWFQEKNLSLDLLLRATSKGGEKEVIRIRVKN